ncbi:MAG: HNH endonuclease [Anaeromyxobacteraceae bacterium]
MQRDRLTFPWGAGRLGRSPNNARAAAARRGDPSESAIAHDWEDGRRCGSTWKLELDHVVPAALGGPSTVENLRLHCRSHNQLDAEQIFGPAHMDLFRHGGPGRVDSLSPGEAHDP